MKTRIVQIGNSLGVLIPARLIKRARLNGDVDISLQEGSLVIRAVATSRAGWAVAFRQMAHQGDDALIDEGSPALTDWDQDKWEW